MASQTDMLRFHRNIKLDHYDENQTLREKRDIALERLRQRGLRFEPFNQGSYAMGTGLLPLESDPTGDYDIDVGLRFSGPELTSMTPTQLKQKVFDAVSWPNQTVLWRKNCIQVQWIAQGKPLYHVDLACYRVTPSGLERAVGKQHAQRDQVKWELSDPEALVKALSDLAPEANAQRRRMIRALKRWKDVNFQATGNARPPGVAITALVLQHFSTTPSFYVTEGQMDDLGALTTVVDRVLASVQRYPTVRLRAPLPVPPGNDTLAKQNDEQQRQLVAKLEQLQVALRSAKRGDDRALAAQLGSAWG